MSEPYRQGADMKNAMLIIFNHAVNAVLVAFWWRVVGLSLTESLLIILMFEVSGSSAAASLAKESRSDD